MPIRLYECHIVMVTSLSLFAGDSDVGGEAGDGRVRNINRSSPGATLQLLLTHSAKVFRSMPLTVQPAKIRRIEDGTRQHRSQKSAPVPLSFLTQRT